MTRASKLIRVSLTLSQLPLLAIKVAFAEGAFLKDIFQKHSAIVNIFMCHISAKAAGAVGSSVPLQFALSLHS